VRFLLVLHHTSNPGLHNPLRKEQQGESLSFLESEEYEFTDVNGNKFTFRGGFNNTELFIYELVNLLKHFLENLA